MLCFLNICIKYNVFIFPNDFLYLNFFINPINFYYQPLTCEIYVTMSLTISQNHLPDIVPLYIPYCTPFSFSTIITKSIPLSDYTPLSYSLN